MSLLRAAIALNIVGGLLVIANFIRIINSYFAHEISTPAFALLCSIVATILFAVGVILKSIIVTETHEDNKTKGDKNHNRDK